jgi:hypothetical protein
METVKESARSETASILQDLGGVRDRAREVRRVLEALDLDVDPDILALSELSLEGIAAVAVPPAATTTPPPAPAPAKPPAKPAVDVKAQRRQILRQRVFTWAEQHPERKFQVPDIATAVNTRRPEGVAEFTGAEIRATLEDLARDKLDKEGENGTASFRLKPPKGATSTAPPAKRDPRAGRTIHHPGPEAVPEHLRWLPAASANGPLKPRISACRDQLIVLRALAAHPRSLAVELQPFIGDIKKNRVGKYFREMREGDRPLVRATGVVRSQRGTSNKPGNEYVITEYAQDMLERYRDKTEDAPATPPAATPHEVPASPPSVTVRSTLKVPTNQELVSAIRSVMPRFDGEWVGAHDVREAIEDKYPGHAVATQKVTDALDAWAATGGIEREDQGNERRGDDHVIRYRYTKPTDPGAAARIDQERRRIAPEREASTPVAGTGRNRPTARNREVEAVLRAARSKLGEGAVRTTGSGHWMIELGRGQGSILVGSNRLDEKDKGKLRAAGIAVG